MLDTYRKTYQHQIYPIDITDLALDPFLLPPRIVKLRGRLKVQRLRKGASKKKLRRCGNCSQMSSHNARSCRAQPCDIHGDAAQNIVQNAG